MEAKIRAKAQHIKLLILDVDGVLTDGRLYFTEQGETLKIFNVQDGLGIKLLQSVGVTVAVITSRQSPMVAARLTSLGVTYLYQGVDHKATAYETLLQNLQVQEHEVAYVGDDLPDLPVLTRVGLGIAVANAVPVVQQQAVWQTGAKGGEGAVREVCDLIISAQAAWPQALALYPGLSNYSAIVAKA